MFIRITTTLIKYRFQSLLMPRFCQVILMFVILAPDMKKTLPYRLVRYCLIWRITKFYPKLILMLTQVFVFYKHFEIFVKLVKQEIMCLCIISWNFSPSLKHVRIFKPVIQNIIISLLFFEHTHFLIGSYFCIQVLWLFQVILILIS